MSEHKACGENVDNIFRANSKEGLLLAFICTKCNYMQIRRDRLVQHMVKQHKLTEAVECVDFEKVMLVPNMSTTNIHLKEFEYIKANRRYSCTVCLKRCQSASEFAIHFDEAHSQTVQKYKCFCGEVISIDGCLLMGNYISAHLKRHKAHLFKCYFCPVIFYDQNDIKDHLLNDHDEDMFKFCHIHREHKKQPILTETVVQKMTCDVCNVVLANPTCASAIEHFKVLHQTDNVSLIVYVSKKVCCNNNTKFSVEKFVMNF